MFLDFTVPIPDVKGKVFIKKIKDFHYVHYQYENKYDPVRKYALPKRTTIGKVCDDDPSLMYPNDNYLKFFPDSILPELRSSERSSCLRVGTHLVIDKIIHECGLQGILNNIIGKKYGLFLDLVAYTIICENNASQYYPDYAYDHPLFTEDMKIYSDSSVSEFLKELTIDDSVIFLNTWNDIKDHGQKIYISYDSTNKKSQAGDIDLVEVGHSKEGLSDTIFNFSIAYDRTNREPLFYEDYPGSITDISQLQYTIEKAQSFGYKNIGFILDRGYFSEANIRYMDQNGYDFIMMVKGMKSFVKKIVLNNYHTFEDSYKNIISEFDVSGTTVNGLLFPSDKKLRWFHLYFNEYKAAIEKQALIKKIDEMKRAISEHQGEHTVFPKVYDHYFDIIYWHKGEKDQKLVSAMSKDDVIEEEMKLCGYFVIVTSEEMSAREAILLYKSRDDSEKLFRGDKSYLGERSERVYGMEAFRSKIFIEFVALIVRCRIYVSLIEEMKRTGKRPNYMTVPAAIRELEKIEMIRYGRGTYHLDHAITKTQKDILKAFSIDTRYVTEKTGSLSVQLSTIK